MMSDPSGETLPPEPEEEATAHEGVQALIDLTTTESSPEEAAPPTDTVAVAARTPDRAQPYEELGLKVEEYERVREILGRRPTSAELAIYSVMWSEHCSYKSSKVHLRQFGEKAPDNTPDVLLVG
ncbi:MAG: hypothetical protein ACRDOO_12270, partial [Actinomadura sp.]